MTLPILVGRKVCVAIQLAALLTWLFISVL